MSRRSLRLLTLAWLLLAIAPLTRAEQAVRTDRHGDPLPPGAVGRLGTIRFRTFNQPIICLMDRHWLSADGKWLAVIEDDGMARVLGTADGKEVRRFQVTEKSDFTQYEMHGTVLLAASAEGGVRCWDVATGKLLRTFPVQEAQSAAFEPSADGKVLGAVLDARDDQKRRMVLYDAISGKERSSFELSVKHASEYLNTRLSADGSKVVSWVDPHNSPKEEQGFANVWDTATGKRLHRVGSDHGSVTGAALSPDGQTLVLTTTFSRILFWDLTKGRAKATIQTVSQFSGGTQPYFSPDGKLLALADGDGSVQLWDVRACKRRPKKAGPGGGVCALVFQPDGKVLACNVVYQELVLWEVTSGKVLSGRADHKGAIAGLAFARDGRTLTTAALDGTFLRFDLATGKVVRRLGDVPLYGDLFRYDDLLLRGHFALTVSPDDHHLAFKDTVCLQVLDTAPGGETRTFFDSGSRTGPSSLSPDGSWVATVEGEDSKIQTVRLWDAATGEERAVLPRRKGDVLPHGVRAGWEGAGYRRVGQEGVGQKSLRTVPVVSASRPDGAAVRTLRPDRGRRGPADVFPGRRAAGRGTPERGGVGVGGRFGPPGLRPAGAKREVHDFRLLSGQPYPRGRDHSRG
jgi:WD40 repeat protein